MTNQQLLEVIQRILVNAHIAKNFVEDGKEIFCGRKIDAIIDQLNKLAGVLQEEMVPPSGGDAPQA